MRLLEPDRRALALWAADCAERVLPLFEELYPDDGRPRAAVVAARAWAHGVLTADEARDASFAAHAAAEATEPEQDAARASARAAGHAAATALLEDHGAHAAEYALKAVTYGAEPGHAAAAMADERTWQHERLPTDLRVTVLGDPG